MKRKLMSWALVLALALSLLPTTAFAAGELAVEEIPSENKPYDVEISKLGTFNEISLDDESKTITVTGTANYVSMPKFNPNEPKEQKGHYIPILLSGTAIVSGQKITVTNRSAGSKDGKEISLTTGADGTLIEVGGENKLDLVTWIDGVDADYGSSACTSLNAKHFKIQLGGKNEGGTSYDVDFTGVKLQNPPPEAPEAKVAADATTTKKTTISVTSPVDGQKYALVAEDNGEYVAPAADDINVDWKSGNTVEFTGLANGNYKLYTYLPGDDATTTNSEVVPSTTPYTITEGVTTISEVTLNVTAPVKGAASTAATVKTPTGVNAETTWTYNDGSEKTLTTGDNFAPDTAYTVKVKLTAEQGYTLAPTVKVKFGDADTGTDLTLSTNTVTATKTFEKTAGDDTPTPPATLTAPEADITATTDHSLMVKAPVAGQKYIAVKADVGGTNPPAMPALDDGAWKTATADDVTATKLELTGLDPNTAYFIYTCLPDATNPTDASKAKSAVSAQAYTTKQTDITGATVTVDPTKDAEGNTLTYKKDTAQEPAITVTLGEKTLVKDTDYTVTYADGTGTGAGTLTGTEAIDAGVYQVASIEGKGDYTGTKNLTTGNTFTIAKAERTLEYHGAAGLKPSATLTITIGTAATSGNVLVDSCTEPPKSGNKYTVTSKQPSVATVAYSTDITVTATTQQGDVIIEVVAAETANYAAKTVEIPLTVTSLDIPTLEFDSSSVSKTYGNSEFTAAIKDTSLTDVKYESDNEDVAIVDSTGKVTIKGAGTAKITASVEETVDHIAGSNFYTLTVKPKDISVEVVVPAGNTITYGDTSYTPSIKLATGQETAYGEKLEDLIAAGTMTVVYTDTEFNATDSPYTIDATVTSNNYNVTVTPGNLTVDPKAITATGITITVASPYEYTTAGEECKPAVTVTDGSKTLVENTDYELTYANNKAPGGEATAQTDPSAPTTPAKPKVTVTGIGNYTGTVDKEFEIQQKQTQTQTVEVKSVTLNKTSLTLQVGTSETLTATVNPDNATDNKVSWSSDKPEIASVKDGTVTAVAAGTTTITATAGGKSATCAVNVTETPVTVTIKSVKANSTQITASLSGNTITVTGAMEAEKTATVTCTLSDDTTQDITIAYDTASGAFKATPATVVVGKTESSEGTSYTVALNVTKLDLPADTKVEAGEPEVTLDKDLLESKEPEEQTLLTDAQEAFEKSASEAKADGIVAAVGAAVSKDDDGNLTVKNDDGADVTVTAAEVESAKETLKAEKVETLVVPYLDIKLADATVDKSDNTKKTLTFDIKAMAKIVVVKDGVKPEEIKTEGDDKNAVEMDRVTVNNKRAEINISLPMPKDFIPAGLNNPWVRHEIDRNTQYHYRGSYDRTKNILSFLNPHGFSKFTVLTEDKTAVAKVGSNEYLSLQEAVDAAPLTDGQYVIEVLKGEKVTLDKEGTFVFTGAGAKDVVIETVSGLKVEDKGNNTYVVSKETTPVRPGSSSGSGSGSGGGTGVWGGTGTSTPRVSVNSGNHGKVTTSSATPKKGDIVTLTITPDSGYELDVLTVTSGGQELDVDIDGNKATFEMPGTSVSVKATFRAVGSEPGSGEEPAELPFADIPDDFWAHDEIAWAYDNGYMNGYSATSFNPSGTVTRQQLWMVLARISGENPSDMAAARDWAMANNVSDGSNPGKSVSRQQMVTMLYRYAQLNDYSTEGGTALSSYPDAGVVQSYAEDALSWAVGNGIVNGTSDGRLDPEGTAIRSQFAVILYRFCDTIVK